jgi:hypothetical protein
LFLLPILATVSFLVLTFLERAPHVYNYPIEVTTANAPMIYALGRRSILWLKLIIVVAFGLGFRASVEVALGTPPLSRVGPAGNPGSNCRDRSRHRRENEANRG